MAIASTLCDYKNAGVQGAWILIAFVYAATSSITAHVESVNAPVETTKK